MRDTATLGFAMESLCEKMMASNSEFRGRSSRKRAIGTGLWVALLSDVAITHRSFSCDLAPLAFED